MDCRYFNHKLLEVVNHALSHRFVCFFFNAGGLRFLVQFSITYMYDLALYYIYVWYMLTHMYNHTYMYDFNDLTILEPKYFT